MELNKLKELKRRDFLKYENNFEKTENIESTLLIGQYWEKTPEVTVVIPVYRRPELAQIAVQSVLMQSFKDVQVILVDDEATGEVINPIEDIVRKLDSNQIIYFKNKRNLGLYANWNRCVSLAKSKWVCMVHTDTFLKCEYLKIMMDILHNNKTIKFLCANKEDIDLTNGTQLDFDKYFYSEIGQSAPLEHITYFDYNFAMRGCIQGSIFDRMAFMELGGIKSDGSIVEDFPFMAKYAHQFGIEYEYRKLWVDCLYDNFGANSSIWQEQLVYNYYLYKDISNRRSLLTRWAFKKMAKQRIIEEAQEYCEGTSWIKKKCTLDIQLLKTECMIDNLPVRGCFCTKIEMKLITLTNRYHNLLKRIGVRARRCKSLL